MEMFPDRSQTVAGTRSGMIYACQGTQYGMLTRALASLLRSTDGAGVLTIGGLLTLLTWTVTPLWAVSAVAFPPLSILAPLALAPAFVTRGYFVRVVADAAETGNTDGAPPFVAWNELYKNGVKSAALSVVLLAPLALLLTLVGGAGVVLGTGLIDPTTIVDPVEAALGSGGTTAVVALGAGALTVISAVYLVVFAYVRPAALAAFAVSGRLRDGLHPKRIGRVAGSGTYATAWLVATVTLLIGYAIATPFIFVLIGVVIIFVTRIVAHAVYGHGAGPVVSIPDHTADHESESACSPVPRQSSPEPSPAVQAGRGVPFGGDIGGLIESNDARVSGTGDGGSGDPGDRRPASFDWATDVEEDSPIESREGDSEPGGRTDGEHGDEGDGISVTAENGLRFDWGPSDGGQEDKS